MRRCLLACLVGLTAACCGSAVPIEPPTTADATTHGGDALLNSGADSETFADTLAPPGDGTIAAPGPARAVWVAKAGVDTPWFAAVAEAGAQPPVRLGPVRGAGYGQGEGSVAYPELTPDGKTVVVVFQPLSGGNILYALAIDGSQANAPVLVAKAPKLNALERAYASGWMAWVDGDGLYAAPLDGAKADAPVLVAKAPPGRNLENPHWLAGANRLAFDAVAVAGGAATAYSAAADGTQANTLVALSGAGWNRVAGVLPDGRVLVFADDDRLHAVAATGGEAWALTPQGAIAGLVGISADGKRIVAELRWTWKEERVLVAVDTAEHVPSAPLDLTPGPVADLHALMARDGTRVAWTARGAPGQWAVFEAGLDGKTGPGGLRVTAWSPHKLRVTDYVAGAGALVGTDNAASALRFALPGGSGAAPVVLYQVPQVVNQSGPWPRLSVAGDRVLFDANTATGWHSWTVPLGGGPATALPGAWYRDLVTPHGIVANVHATVGAAFAAVPGQPSVPLTAWHGAPLHEAHLVAGGAWLVYACAAPEPGWYATPTTAMAPAAHRVMPPADTGKAVDWWTKRPAELEGHLVRVSGGTVALWPIATPPAADPPALLKGVTGPVIVHAGRVVARQGQAVVAATPNGASATVLQGDGPIEALAPVPGTDRIVAVTGAGANLRVLSARVDGSDAKNPAVVAQGMSGWPFAILPTPDGKRLILVLSIEATAVPKPDLLLTAPLAPPDAAAVAVLAPKGLVPWSGAPWPDWPGWPEWSEGLTAQADLAQGWAVPGGGRAVLTGVGGLHSAAIDGADAQAPLLLGKSTRGVGPPYSPDGQWLAVADDDSLQVAQPAVAGSERALTVPLPQPVAEAFWSPDGTWLVFRTAPLWDDPATGALYRVAADATAAAPTPLLGSSPAADALLGLTPDGKAAVFASRKGGDHSLYLAPLTGPPAAAASLTPVDDAAETLVGFTAAKVP